MTEQLDTTEPEQRLAGELRLVTNAGLRASSWPRLLGEIPSLAAVAEKRGKGEDLRARVINVLEEATVDLDPEIAKAAQSLYGWKKSWWDVPSKTRREAARDLLFGAYTMSWESFRDRREEAIHIAMAKVILYEHGPRAAVTYSPVLKRNPIWIHYFQLLEPVRRSARPVDTDLMIRDVGLYWDGLTSELGETIESYSERGLAFLMLLDYWIDKYRQSNLPHMLPIESDESDFRQIMSGWPTDLLYPTRELRSDGLRLMESADFDRAVLTKIIDTQYEGELLDRWREIERSPYPPGLLRMDDCASVLYSILTRNFYSNTDPVRVILIRRGRSVEAPKE